MIKLLMLMIPILLLLVKILLLMFTIALFMVNQLMLMVKLLYTANIYGVFAIGYIVNASDYAVTSISLLFVYLLFYVPHHCR
jgi:hypothetical protein